MFWWPGWWGCGRMPVWVLGLGVWSALRGLLLARRCLFALNGAFCGRPGRGERLLRAKLFQGGWGPREGENSCRQ